MTKDCSRRPCPSPVEKVASMKAGGATSWAEMGRTEVVANNLDPMFVTLITAGGFPPPPPFFDGCHPYARKSASYVNLSRMQLTLHASPSTPRGVSGLMQALSAWSVKTRRAPFQHRRDARVCGHTTTAMHGMSTPLPPGVSYMQRTHPLMSDPSDPTYTCNAVFQSCVSRKQWRT